MKEVFYERENVSNAGFRRKGFISKEDTDLIERFQTIDAAIVDSNAKTEISTSYGKFTVAGAISLRSRLRGGGAYDGEADFERRIQYKLQSEYDETVVELRRRS